MPFYKRDLSIHRFWYPWESWNQFPPDIEGHLALRGGVRSYMQICNCAGADAPNPHIVQRSIVYFFYTYVKERLEISSFK